MSGKKRLSSKKQQLLWDIATKFKIPADVGYIRVLPAERKEEIREYLGDRIVREGIGADGEITAWGAELDDLISEVVPSSGEPDST